MSHRIFRFMAGAIWILLLLLPGWLTPATPAWGETPGVDAMDVGSMSLGQLLQLEVTSVSKRPEQLLDAPAAIFVITREDIMRSGYSTIPDLLRLVPGMQVGQLTSSLYAVSARGLASRFSRDLLVLIDGRSVYTPIFSGVYWENQDLPFEDIERIEVIRGPGAALWGANAVNGVINVITRPAVDTQGWYVKAGTGTRERGLGVLRYGGSLGRQAHYRAWGKGVQRGHLETLDHRNLEDSWNLGQGGFRLDWAQGAARNVSFVGALHRGDQGLRYELPSLTDPYTKHVAKEATLSGEYLVARCRQQFSPSSEVNLQAYVDHEINGDSGYYDERTTFDFDTQHHFAPLARLNVTWGMGYRRTDLAFRGSDYIVMHDGQKSSQVDLGSAFIQGELGVVPDRFQVTASTKLEAESGKVPELQPSLRLLWHPGASQALWASVSRAVRTPSLAEQHASMWLQTIPPFAANPQLPFPVKVVIEGNPEMRSEKLTAWESGYRIQPTGAIYFDLAVFAMEYRGLRKVTLGDPVIGAGFVLQPLRVQNGGTGRSRGAEVSSNWYARSWLQLRASYTYQDVKKTGPGSEVQQTSFVEFHAPRHLAMARGSFDLARAWKVDLVGRYVAAIPFVHVASYAVLDASLAWLPIPVVELRLSGMNLGGGGGHEEYPYELDNKALAAIKPGVSAACTCRF
jgi:iron complex outermembrane receptor protein